MPLGTLGREREGIFFAFDVIGMKINEILLEFWRLLGEVTTTTTLLAYTYLIYLVLF